MKNAVIVIPTYNESENIESLVHEIFSITGKVTGWSVSILIVDSSSPDGTINIVKKLETKYKKLHSISTKKEGLGKAYLHGFTVALNTLHADVIFEMDADSSHDPKNLPEFIHNIDQGADFVIGSRYRRGGSIPADWGLKRKAFSVLGNIIIRLGFMKLSITDWTSGYRAMKAWVAESSLDYIKQHTGYVFQVALLENAIKQHAIIQELPIQFVDRKYGVSKLNSGQYIQNTLWYVFSHSSFVKYVIVGGSGFVIDFGLSFALIESSAHFPVWLATVISAELAIIWNFFWNNYWAFAHKKVSHKSTAFLKSLAAFNGVAIGSIIIQAGLIQFFVSMFGRSLWFVYKICILLFIIIPYSYVLYNKVIWKNEKPKTE